MKLKRGAAFLAMVTLLALPSLGVAETEQICFYVDKGLPGHVFVQMLPSVAKGNPQGGRLDLVYGKYPSGPNMFVGGAGPTTIRWDARRAWDQRICYPVTVAQYNAAVAKIRGKILIVGEVQTPSPYHLLRRNCVHWMTDVATAAGLVLPNKVNFLGIRTPGAFGRALKELGPGGMFGGGTVGLNLNLNLGADGNPIALNPPRDFDAEELAMESHNDPTALATATGLPLNEVDLGSFTTTVAAGLTVALANTDPEDALISVDWGDGSNLEAQSLGFGHNYATLGTYNGSVAVVNSGDINVYRMQVSVNTGGPINNVVNATVPTPTPAVGSNPGFENPPNPEYNASKLPALPVWAGIAMAALLFVAGILVFGKRRTETQKG